MMDTQVMGGISSATGRTVTPESALQLSAVYACVRILAETVASLPLRVYRRRPDGGKEPAPGHPLYHVLHDAGNPEMTAFELRETMMGHLVLRGNSYAEIERNGYTGDPAALWPLRPDRMTVKRPAQRLVYEYELPDGTPKVFQASQILHVRGLSSNGIVGMSPIAVAREAIGLGLAAEEFGARFFGNGARPGVVLEHPGELSDAAYERLKGSWNEQHQGLTNAQRLAILEEGMKVSVIGVPPNDAQFLETRKFQVVEIARLFRVPPHMIGDLDRATFSNIEQQSIEFVTHTIRPWTERLEQRYDLSLLDEAERAEYFVEHLLDGLLRGDITSRYQSYATGRQWGWLSVNDIRALENMNPVEGGEEYLVPMNMAPAGEAEPSTNGATNARMVGGVDDVRARTGEGMDGMDGMDRLDEAEQRAARDRRTVEGRRRLSKTYRPTLRHMAQRIVNREVNDLRQAARRYLPGDVARFRQWLAEFDGKHAAFVGEYMDAPVRSYLALVGEQVEREVDKPVTAEMLEQFGTDYVAGRRNRWMANLMRGVEGVLDDGERGAGSGERTERGADGAGSDRSGERREEPDVLEEMEAWLDERAEGEADDYAEDESNTGSNAAAVALYLLLGIQAKRWMAFGESCEYCQALDGRTVATAQWFVDPDNPLSVASGPVWVPSGNVGHAPLHGGCDCMVVAG